jgi:serine/threonine-protein kinase
LPITIGSQLNSLQVTALLGKGGMGEVYRARDTRLKRDVAVKVLPPEFSRDPDRVSRLQREAEVLASLNHPNIAAIYDVQETTGSQYLVLELVEGETLAARLERGAIPTGEALAIARGICEALEAAHEQGVVHRDLKPANVKITPDGRVKVLDFGLARIQEPAARLANASNSPTLSVMHTVGGVILGTASYMSPEQARGKTVDKRSDVWAFGCVLFEMLTGSRVFDGEEITDIIAAIVRAEPNWGKLPADTPAAIRRLLRRCLEKDRRERLPDIATARLEIKDALAPTPEVEVKTEQDGHVPSAAPKRALVAWLLVSVFAVLSVAMLVIWRPWRAASPVAPVRVSVELGADVSLASNIQGNSALAISPDGSVVAFVGQKDGASQIYVRRLDQLQASPLAGTKGAIGPFFSPDGRWIGFFADAKLKKISITGGAAISLCDATTGRGAWWDDDGNIVFQRNALEYVGLYRVSSNGGTPESLTNSEKDGVTHRWPQVLPGTKAVLYTSSTTISTFADADVVVQPLPSGAPKVLFHGGYHAQYLDSGHLLYIHDGTLFSVPFDVGRLQISGQPVPVNESVASALNTGAAQFAVSRNGTFIYLSGGTNASNDVPVMWMTRDGKTSRLSSAANWGNLSFSPDGRMLAMDVGPGSETDVSIYDLARDTSRPLTLDPARDQTPVWTPPDGRGIVFASDRAEKGRQNLYWQHSDGTGSVQRLTESPNNQLPGSWHPSGKYLAFQELSPQTADDIMILPMEGDEVSGWKPGTPYSFLKTPVAERQPQFSPDGRWIAYVSAEPGGAEVFVRPFPGPGGKWKISATGAAANSATPRWSRKRQEILYLANDNRIMRVSFQVQGDAFMADTPTVWSEQPIEPRVRLGSFALHPDGERIAASVPDARTEEKRDKVVFIFNFFDELRRLAPVKN